MRIKTTKKMNLWQTIKHVQENDDLFNGKMELFFVSDDGRAKLEFDNSGTFQTDQWIDIDEDTFTVEVEEELTEDAEFEEVVIVTKNQQGHSTSYTAYCETLRDAVNERPSIFKVYALTKGSLYLIWSCDTGIPTEGVIET